jgi:hypothetical protein
MQTRRFTIVLSKPILTIALILLLGGIRLFCDLGTAISTSQHITETNNTSRTEPGCAGGECHDEHDRGCSEGSSPTPSDSPQHQCCTNWFVFTTDPTTISYNNNSNGLLSDTTIPPAATQFAGTMVEGYRFRYPIGRNHASSYPLYLATHALRV